MDNNREILKIVVVGHVDHGKSTVIGRLLYDTKSIPEGKIERVKNNCKEKGKPFEYAYLLDAFEEEQKQGITIDTTQLQFFTQKRDYVIIDAPGHKEFLKNMISGAASAEAALLIIDAHEGVQEQSKRHGYILSLLGIQKVYVIVNKMDLIDYSEDRFKLIREEMNDFLKSVHVHPMKYIPISGFYGENITKQSDKMPWYKGEAVLDAIDLIEKDKELDGKPLRFPIQDVYKFDNRRIIAGRIESGTLKVGDSVFITPGEKVTRVKSIESWPNALNIESVSAGMSVGITVEDEFFNQRGEFIAHKENPPIVTDAFKANLFWMGKNALCKGIKYKLKLATQEVECQIVVINKVIDATTLQSLEDAEQVKMNDVAEVTIKTKEKISFDEFKNNQNTGRFVLVEGYDVSGGGIITGSIQKTQEVCKLLKNEIEFVVSCFDEHYYHFNEERFIKVPHIPLSVNLGDAVPVFGETYTYPSDFDILDKNIQYVAQVKNSLLQDIIPIERYVYEGKHLLTHQGFLVKVSTQAVFDDFKEVITKSPSPLAVANKWYDFMAFKNIKAYNKDKDNDFTI